MPTVKSQLIHLLEITAVGLVLADAWLFGLFGAALFR